VLRRAALLLIACSAAACGGEAAPTPSPEPRSFAAAASGAAVVDIALADGLVRAVIEREGQRTLITSSDGAGWLVAPDGAPSAPYGDGRPLAGCATADGGFTARSGAPLPPGVQGADAPAGVLCRDADGALHSGTIDGPPLALPYYAMGFADGRGRVEDLRCLGPAACAIAVVIERQTADGAFAPASYALVVFDPQLGTASIAARRDLLELGASGGGPARVLIAPAGILYVAPTGELIGPDTSIRP